MAWTPEQLQNAGLIYQVGRELMMTNRDIQIALITAMVESNLTNVDYGDRDSLGLFQQRPSQGWGTPEQVMNPRYAATKFFNALKDVDRYNMSMGEAAQAVQRSAFPDRYGERIGAMREIWPEIQATAGEQPQSLDGGSYFGAEGPQTPLVAPGGSPAITSPIPSAEAMLGAWGMSSPQFMEIPELAEAGTFISPTTNDVITQISEEVGGYQAGVDGWRKAVINAARTALGKPYVWGGSNLASGVDCSGLIMAAFARAGITMPRVSYQQANRGKRVGLDALRPGDLYAWDNSTRNNGADHIALYLGNGQILEAPRPGGVVRVRSLDGDEGGWGVQLNFD